MRSIFVLALLLNACSSAPAAPNGIANFHMVDEGVYRGAQPDAQGIKYLKSIGVKSIVKLNSENMSEEAAAAESVGIDLFSVPLPGLWAPSDADEKDVQNILSDKSLYPLFIHCQHGQDRTGLSIALFRVHHDGWQPGHAHQEWMSLGHSPLLFLMDRYFNEHTEAQ